MNVFGTKKSGQTIYGNSFFRGDVPVTIKSGAPATTDILNVPTLWIDSSAPDNMYFLTNINTISGAAEWILMNDITSISPLTTKGDVLVYSTANTRLPVGTNSQALIADSAQTTGLRWATIIPTTTKGDLFTNTGSADVRLPVGTNSQALIADSSQTTGLRWATIIPTTTKGDIFVHDGSASARLPAGLNNQVLIADNTATEGARWATISFSPVVVDITEVEAMVEAKTR